MHYFIARSTSLVALFFCALANPVMAASAVTENKRLVTDFYQMMFVEHRVEEAVSAYLAEDYIQHNPYLADGRQTLADYFVPFYANNPEASVEMKRVLADGDLVAVHAHWKRSAEDRGNAVVDLFRVNGDRIVEHWDVVQAIPATSANDNGIF